jgi:hypothetical protein
MNQYLLYFIKDLIMNVNLYANRNVPHEPRTMSRVKR